MPIEKRSDPFNMDAAISSFLGKHKTDGSTKKENLIAVTKAVAEIPWGEGRSIQDVLTKGVGTCIGKHKVLQACYEKLGIGYRTVVCTFKWSEQGLRLPQHLKEILDEGEWEHGHNFVQLKNGNDLDITWNSKLAQYGFQALPKDWDDSQSFIGIKNPIKRWDGAKIDEMKTQLIGDLDSGTRDRREKFLNGLIQWIELINNG